MKELVSMSKITKKFPGVVALSEIDFSLNEGEVHVLLGENGAGKSTLMKILSGIYTPTEGTIRLDGQAYDTLTPKLAQQHRISIIHQELSVIDELTIAENLYVGKLPAKRVAGIQFVDHKQINETTRALLKRVGLQRSPDTPVEELSISEKQMVEIAKALAANAKILIMDEPTSSLTLEETDTLFSIVRKLKSEGVGIIYISHKLKEIEEIGDRVTVLKDGTYVGTKRVAEITIDDMIQMMVGRELNDKYVNPQKDQAQEGQVIFRVSNLTRKDNRVRNVSFELKQGEILGFAGLIGSGRTELMDAIYGVAPIASGDIELFGEHFKPRSPYESLKKGMAYITENRRATGFFHNFSIKKNIAQSRNLKLSSGLGVLGLTKDQEEDQWAEDGCKKLNVKCANIEQNITELSGGNQQKVIIARSLIAESEFFIFDEPTRGIDVGAKSEIYKIMRQLASEGKGVLMVSSELPELLSNCDRIAVFNQGEIHAVLPNHEATEEKIMAYATE